MPLAHRYSLAEIDFGALKNHDAAAAQALARAALMAGCTLRLAVLSIHETGSAEPVWGGYHRYDDEDDDTQAYEVVEVIDRVCTLRAWRAPDGGREEYGDIGVDEESEVAPPDALDDAEPDEDQLHEATGNGGASYERTFRWALVLWPNARELEVLEQGGADALFGAVARYATTDRDRALSLARHSVAAWSRLHGAGPAVAPRHARALQLFEALGDLGLVADFLAAIAATGGLGGAWGPRRRPSTTRRISTTTPMKTSMRTRMTTTTSPPACRPPRRWRGCRAGGRRGRRRGRPPANATREDDGFTCRCANCTALRAFHRDPVKTQWELRAAQQDRRHIEEQVRRARVDVAMHTIEKGRPYTLVCTKTAARYEARVRQRAADTAALAVIDAWRGEG